MTNADYTRSIPFSVAGDQVGKLCRSMTEAGLSGSLCVVDLCTGKPVFHIPDIARRAHLAVRENDARGPHYTKWQPHPMAASRKAAE